MSQLRVPQFESYEDEADFWDQLDTADFMDDDGEWLRFETPRKRAVRVAILPEIAQKLAERARSQGVTLETLVNAWLIEDLQGSTPAG